MRGVEGLPLLVCRHSRHLPRDVLIILVMVVSTSKGGRVQVFLLAVIPTQTTEVPVLTKNMAM